MNDIHTIAVTGVAPAAISSAPASRGVLAMQGTGLSLVDTLGAAAQAPQYAAATDKPEWGRHRDRVEAFADVFDRTRAVDRNADGPWAPSLHRTRSATVISSRPRSRLR